MEDTYIIDLFWSRAGRKEKDSKGFEMSGLSVSGVWHK